MRRILILTSLAILSLVSCGESSDEVLEESAQDASSIESIMVDKFEYQYQDDNEYICIMDLLQQLIMYGYNSQKYKIGLVIEGDALQKIESGRLINIKGETLGEILELICETTGTYYEIEYGRIVIKSKTQDP